MGFSMALPWDVDIKSGALFLVGVISRAIEWDEREQLITLWRGLLMAMVERGMISEATAKKHFETGRSVLILVDRVNSSRRRLEDLCIMYLGKNRSCRAVSKYISWLIKCHRQGVSPEGCVDRFS